MDRCRYAPLLILAVLLPALPACEEEPPSLPSIPPTTPPPARPSMNVEPPCKPPHGGRLLPMADNRGHVEWVISSGRAYILDNSCQPADGAADVVLTCQTAGAPRQVALIDCADKDYPGSCWTSPGGELRDTATGVIRFTLKGEPVRVALSPAPPVENAAGAVPPVAPSKRAGP